jgi:hypothetical protein
MPGKKNDNIVSGQTFRPLGSRFKGRKSLPDEKGQLWATVNIYDSSFNKVREIYRQKSITKIPIICLTPYVIRATLNHLIELI